jgi:ribonuclease P protein component
MRKVSASPAGQRFTKAMRLQQEDVRTVLRAGKTIKGPGQSGANSGAIGGSFISVKCLVRSDAGTTISSGERSARIAISVPKRLMKAAIDRNRFKRIVREVFRSHDIRGRPIDMLVLLTAKVDSLKQLPKATMDGGLRTAFTQVESVLSAIAPRGM